MARNAGEWWTRGDVARATIVLLLLVVAVVWAAGVGLLPTPASHAWSVEVQPASDDAAWVARVPYLVAPADPERRETLQRLTDDLHVDAGLGGLRPPSASGEFRLVENGTLLELRGEGPLTVAADVWFFGDVGEREAFLEYHLDTANVTLLEGPGGGVEVTWRTDMSGGWGHTCSQEATLTATVAPGGVAPLQGEGLYTHPRQPGVGLRAICA